MIKIDASKAIAQMVESFFPSFSDPKLGLYIALDIRYHDYGFDDGGNKTIQEEWGKSIVIEFLFHRPSNYTKVLARAIDFSDPDLMHHTPEAIEMKIYSDHDSYWKPDGMTILDNIWSNIRNEYKKTFPDRNSHLHLSEFVSFFLFSEPKFVELETLNPVRQDDGYVRSYMVKVGKKLSIREAAQYMPDNK